MERLTCGRSNGNMQFSGYWSQAKKQELVDRLAAYEDTGLDPKYIRKLKERDTAETMYFEGDGYADGNPVYDGASCPNCGVYFEDGDDNWEANFCPNCGKRLNWEIPEVEEDDEE